MKNIIKGKCYVVGDNIDTDAIIPAQYLNWSHTDEEGKRNLARFAMAGLPDDSPAFVKEGAAGSEYKIIVAGDNFGCGSSRAQAPGALNAAGVEAVIANYYARIFYRNSVNSGLLIPVEAVDRICDIVKTDDEIEIRLNEKKIVNLTQNTEYEIKDLGAVKDILEAGDVFAYANKMLKK